MVIVPTIIEKTHGGERAYDIYSRMLEDRVIFCMGAIEERMATNIVSQLLYLEKKDPDKDIIMYINSPGGSVNAGMSIYDTMQYIKCDVATVGMGMAASMGSLLLTAGAKGKRYALPHAEIMIHQPLGGAQWQATEIAIAAQNILKRRKILNNILVKHTGQKLATIENDVERDNYMMPQDALKYWLIDKIIGEAIEYTK